MTRDEFASLPPRIALELIYDMARTKLVNVPRPEVPKPPLYDGRLSKGNEKGFVWMSEMALSDLEWWATAKEKSAAEGGRYAEQNAKSAATLRKWIAWRMLFPFEPWSGKRGEDRVTAAMPSRSPELHAWGPRSDSKKPASQQSERRAPAPDDRGNDEDDLGF